jgi:hypothetical protein
MRKAPVSQASAPLPFPLRRHSQPATCKDSSPKREPYSFATKENSFRQEACCFAEEELYGSAPEPKAHARAA